MSGQTIAIVEETGTEAKQAKKTLTSPYLNARRAWNSHIESVLVATRTWQIVALLALLITVGAIGGIIYIGSQSRLVPYVVEVDKLGQAVAVNRADTAQKGDGRVIQAMVANFVSDARMVTPDGELQTKAINRVYGMLQQHDPAREKMNDWFNGGKNSSPFKRAEKEIVGIQIMSVLQQSASSWQVDWVETVRDREGTITTPPFRMRAIITVYIVPPGQRTTEEQLRSNPIGMFVKDFNWSKTS
jgi:type IV secretion system protein TrbF